MPPTGTAVKHQADDLFHTPLDQAQIDFENEGGETYICGNPPYLGSTWQSREQKEDMEHVFGAKTSSWKSLDYVAAWFIKASEYGTQSNAAAAFVSTNSICQGQQVSLLWPLIFRTGHHIAFAHSSFKWANLASNKAGVTVIIVGISNHSSRARLLFSVGEDGSATVKECFHINAYLVSGREVIVEKTARPLTEVSEMTFGSKPVDGGHLLLSRDDLNGLRLTMRDQDAFVRPIYGSDEFIGGRPRFCLWIEDKDALVARAHPQLGPRLDRVRSMRLDSPKPATQRGAEWPHRFDERRQTGDEIIIAVAAISSENREYLPCGLLPRGTIISNKCFALFDAPLWNLALIASRLHWVWIGTVCARMRTDFSYSNTLGWNTFPVPTLTEQNRRDLTATAAKILLAREAHFPASIADLYDPAAMPENLRQAHDANDEVLERIYIGRRFKNDTERLEKLFDLYSKMVASQPPSKKKGKRAA